MNGFIARVALGWCVGVSYSVTGARERVLRKLRSGVDLPVVIHALTAGELDRILDWLRSHDVLDRLWLSFDDGWLTVKECVPVLEKYRVKAKVFIAPGETVRGSIWTSTAYRAGVSVRIWNEWYSLPESERYERLAMAGGASSNGVRELLTKDDVVALSRNPLIEIENHTWSHLSAVHRPITEVLDEIERAQKTLTEWTGRAPTHLAWPFGRGNAELDSAVVDMGLVPVYTRPGYEVPRCRNMAREGMSFQENLGRLLGAWPRIGATL